jgi:hypothetical protein
MQRYGSILRWAQLKNKSPGYSALRYMYGVAYGVRSDKEILPLDV